MNKTNDVVGLGNVLLDFLIEVDEQHLIEMNLRKGDMVLVDEVQAQGILKQIEDQQLKVDLAPGGSVANTLRGIGFLGGSAILCGKVGNDKHGEYYIQQMKGHNVVFETTPHSSLTGHAITFITPDAQRTFSVFLGASVHLAEEDILEEDIAKSKILHIEGYQFEGNTRSTVLHAISLAQKHGTLVSLDLADAGVIRRNKNFFWDIVTNFVDILFVNETEAKEFTGKAEEEALMELSEQVSTAIVKLGERGSLLSHEGVMTIINPAIATAVDTTGAGDSYAAGFLYGFCREWDIERCGKLGSLLAAKVVERKGVRFDEFNAEDLFEALEKRF